MEKFDILQDIATRTNGDIYLGVVGPVRTGKSTFIKRFMELLVLPNMEESHEQQRALDELPQSGSGKTIMTTEPKFIPSDAVRVEVKEGIDAAVRLVDCVGYAVNSALGYQEEEGPRMVNTPWYDYAIPFQEAAEVGTQKVITDHSTLGIVVTTDGSITDIPREDYEPAEERVVSELTEIGKPFVMIYNTKSPNSEATIQTVAGMQEKYGVSVLPMDISRMDLDDVLGVLRELLMEFPVTEVNVGMPRWMEELGSGHWLREQFETVIAEAIQTVSKIRDIDNLVEAVSQVEAAESVALQKMDLGSGVADIAVNVAGQLFYQILEEYAGMPIEGEHTLLRVVRDFSNAYREWDKVAEAMAEARGGGYGVVTPHLNEMYLEEPELIKQGGRFGVRLKASAPSFHVIRANISTEITPLIGTEKQCEELVRYILSEFEEDPQKIWQTNIFGKSLNELVQEGIQGKLYKMPENAQVKLQDTLQRIVNEGGGGLICIIL
ncbi:MAG: stage IV sporulation protein A [Bacillota bacterium]